MRPGFRIQAGSRDITATLWNGESGPLVSMTITDEAGVKADTVELVVDNRQSASGRVFGPPLIGSEIDVWLGYEPQPAYMGKFRVDEWTKSGPPSILTITAKSADLTSAIKERRVRSWHE